MRGGRRASHNNFPSEPHSPHFLVWVTSESSSFDYYVFKVSNFQRNNYFVFNLATLGQTKWIDLKHCNDYIKLEFSNPWEWGQTLFRQNLNLFCVRDGYYTPPPTTKNHCCYSYWKNKICNGLIQYNFLL